MRETREYGVVARVDKNIEPIVVHILCVRLVLVLIFVPKVCVCTKLCICMCVQNAH